MSLVNVTSSWSDATSPAGCPAAEPGATSAAPASMATPIPSLSFQSRFVVVVTVHTLPTEYPRVRSLPTHLQDTRGIHGCLSGRERPSFVPELDWKPVATSVAGREISGWPTRTDVRAGEADGRRRNGRVRPRRVKDNQPGFGSHVCNAGYMVDPAARGAGVGRALCAHSIEVARGLGYRAMQFNIVVSTNEAAVRLWQSMGFEIVGTLPEAFEHARLGFVDAFVMHRRL